MFAGKLMASHTTATVVAAESRRYDVLTNSPHWSLCRPCIVGRSDLLHAQITTPPMADSHCQMVADTNLILPTTVPHHSARRCNAVTTLMLTTSRGNSCHCLTKQSKGGKFTPHHIEKQNVAPIPASRQTPVRGQTVWVKA